MSTTKDGITEWPLADRRDGMKALERSLNGTSGQVSSVEAMDNLAFEELAGELGTLVGAAGPADRAELHFKLALYRSLRYATCGSVHCHKLGLAGKWRTAYEEFRHLIPAQT